MKRLWVIFVFLYLYCVWTARTLHTLLWSYNDMRRSRKNWSLHIRTNQKTANVIWTYEANVLMHSIVKLLVILSTQTDRQTDRQTFTSICHTLWYHHHHEQAPSRSVAVSTRCFQCSRSWVYFHAELRPRLRGWRSASGCVARYDEDDRVGVSNPWATLWWRIWVPVICQ